MDDSMHTISIVRLREQAACLKKFGIVDDVLFCEIMGTEPEACRSFMDVMACPLRFDGFMCCFCRAAVSGSVSTFSRLRSGRIPPRLIAFSLKLKIFN